MFVAVGEKAGAFHYWNAPLLYLLVLNPLAGIDKRLYPRCHFIHTMFLGIPGTLPGEDGTLQMGHHGEMATVSRADTSHLIVGTIGVGRISCMVVLGYDMRVALSLRKSELSFSVSNPYTELAAGE